MSICVPILRMACPFPSRYGHFSFYCVVLCVELSWTIRSLERTPTRMLYHVWVRCHKRAGLEKDLLTIAATDVRIYVEIIELQDNFLEHACFYKSKKTRFSRSSSQPRPPPKSPFPYQCFTVNEERRALIPSGPFIRKLNFSLLSWPQREFLVLSAPVRPLFISPTPPPSLLAWHCEKYNTITHIHMMFMIFVDS